MRGRRVQHFLEPLVGPIRHRKFLSWDIESKDGDTQNPGFTRPFMVGIYDGSEYTEFRDEEHLKLRPWKQRHILPGGCIDKTMNFLLDPRFSNWQFFAHNAGNFDALFTLAWLMKHNDEFGFEVVPVQSSIQKISVWRLPDDPEDPIKEKWTFLDSMKLYPSGLDKMLKTFGLAGKVEHDLAMDEDDPRWTEYLRQDCIGLYTGLERIHDLMENKLGGEVGMTAPASSMKLWRRQYLGRGGSPNRVPRHTHFADCQDKKTCLGCCHGFVRRAYYGGRTEVFRMYGSGLHYYDINSSYVAAMKEDMPAGDRYVTDKIDMDLHDKNVGFVECRVQIPKTCEIPPLPHRFSNGNGKLMFPTGIFEGVWDLDELRLLEHPEVNGKILAVRKVVWFRRKPLFVDMMDKLWWLRDKSNPEYDEGLSALAKLMGNSLYGKFGMQPERTQIVFKKPNCPNKCFLCNGETNMMICGDCEGSKPANQDPNCEVWYQRRRVEAAYIIPQIAAHITSLARIRLWKFMQEARAKGGKIYYADTDSILTDVILPSSGSLGALKDEYPGQELEGTFIQPKVYMLSGGNLEKPKVTMKGFPPRLRTEENLKRLQEGIQLRFSRLEKVRTLARKKFSDSPEMVEVKKSFKSKYDKRVIQEDGNTVAVDIDERPLYGEEIE